VSPPKLQVAEDHVSLQGQSEPDETQENLVRDDSDYDLYAGPTGHPSGEDILVTEGNTEPNTDEEERDAEFYTSLRPAHITDSEHVHRDRERQPSKTIDISSDSDTSASVADDTMYSTKSHDVTEAGMNKDNDASVTVSQPRMRERSVAQDDLIVLDDAPDVVMPPPTLSLLQTNFESTFIPGLLTPIGKEPSSPNLHPLDSSTLPMPSPFPGGSGDGEGSGGFDVGDWF